MTSLNLNSFSLAGLNQFAVSTLPTIATSVLVVGLASTTATLTWQMTPSYTKEAPPAVVGRGGKHVLPRASSSDQVHKQIPHWHLFGVTQKAIPQRKKAPEPVPEHVPETKLNLTLKGVVASLDMTDAWAIIADRMGNEDSYGLESALPGGATLKEIYSDRIILLHNGRLETLLLPKLGGQNKALPKRRSSHRNKRVNQRNTSKNTRTTRLHKGTVNRVSEAGSAVLKNYREKLMTDPQSVMNTVRAEPYRQAGKLKGYRIFPGRDKNLFGQLGLEPGDVVISVNGISLDSPLKGLEVMQNVTDASEVSVEVLRNGVSQTYVVPMN
ncbi:MAG TPA: type II secretion system protein GspC [Gammaproteobacteria bacterium]|nr:type II secretion system protein GspC [Gammaproteobacteria bacterium]